MCPFDCKASIKIRYAYLNKKVNSSPGPLRFSGAKSVQVLKGLFTWSDTALVQITPLEKELRKVLKEYLQWIRATKKDYTFQKVMETQKDLKDTDGFDWLKSPAGQK